MTRIFLLIAAVLGFFGVALGAFGAHGLEAVLTATGRADTFETANRYHMYHTLALLAVAWLATLVKPANLRWIKAAGGFFVAGTLIFSGSLYLLAVTNMGWLGAVAPIGGTALIIAWALLGWVAWNER